MDSINRVDTENLILEKEKRPVLWDASSENYANRYLRTQSWGEIIKVFVPDFENLSVREKNKLLKYFII